MQKVYENARNLMNGYCKVCRECNGIACSGEVPGMGGIGTAASFKANIKALHDIHFNMRLIHNAVEPTTSISVLGKKLALPIFAAPIGGVPFNMSEGVSEEEYIEAIILGCKEKGIIGCTGDGVPDFIHETGLSVIKKAQGYGIPFIKPWEHKELSTKIDKVRKCGTDIMGIDIDAAGLITLKKMGRPVTPKTVAELAEIMQSIAAKFILKGIMTVADARLAVEAGADAIVVSNHGGRVLDFTPGVASVLPDICAAVKGKITIIADGGVRTGGDVLKLLALGADAVMIGRPFAIAAVGGGQKGVAMYIDKIATELEQAMVLTGVPTINDISKDILHNF